MDDVVRKMLVFVFVCFLEAALAVGGGAVGVAAKQVQAKSQPVVSQQVVITPIKGAIGRIVGWNINTYTYTDGKLTAHTHTTTDKHPSVR